MNRALLIFAFLFSFSEARSQRIHLVDTANRWTVEHSAFAAPDQGTSLLFLQLTRDTFCFSHTYKVMDIVSFTNTGTIVPGSGAGVGYLYREDTSIQKAWCINFLYSDTAEHLIYNAAWKAGDSIQWKGASGVVQNAKIIGIDSTQINNVWHKVFNFQNSGGSSTPRFKVVEGIGSDGGPGFPAMPSTFEDHWALRCFTNTHVIPAGGSNLSFSLGQNCLLSIGKDVVTGTNEAKVFPNPFSSSSKIILPYSLEDGDFSLYNSSGQLIANTRFRNISGIPLTVHNLKSGIFFYRVIDNKSAKIFSGRFLVE